MGDPRSAVLEPAGPAVEMEASDWQGGEGDKPLEKVVRLGCERTREGLLVLESHEHEIQERRQEEKMEVYVSCQEPQRTREQNSFKQLD